MILLAEHIIKLNEIKIKNDMKNFIPILLVMLYVNTSFAQKRSKEIKVPMEAAHWKHNPKFTEFVTHKSVKALKLKNGASVTLNDIEFTDGIIEYDVELTGMGFPGIYFRMSEDNLSGEHFYIRSFGPTSPLCLVLKYGYRLKVKLSYIIKYHIRGFVS
ncbi:MAG: hypothetical protein OEW67_14670 [Cyclobacteriaceae bacterium]|nr:hypothetical protein [Cyclobacteriaceae bacterium]